ncbi:MAG: exo-alpha-sialidase [Candidatus Sigynarchaeota archaeon]
MIKQANGISIETITTPVAGKLLHAHCSTIVAFPDGELVAAWYWAVKEAHIDEEIYISRKLPGQETWEQPKAWGLKSRFFFDGNPVLWVAPDTGVLHLFYNAGWGWSFVFAKHKTSTDRGRSWKDEKNVYPFVSRGVKNPPILTTKGTYVLPAYVEFKYLRGVFFISADKGKTWRQSSFVDLHPDLVPAGYESKKGRQVEQPTVIERRDGSLLALFRNDGKPMRKMLESTSTDGGFTWTPATNGVLPNPAGGFHMMRLASGNIAIIYNHAPSPGNEQKSRNPLSVALSEDDGVTWSYRKNLLEWHQDDGGNAEPESFGYPTLSQGPDGRLHATWSRSHVISLNGVAQRVTDIQYTSFTETWVKERPFFEDAWESI